MKIVVTGATGNVGTSVLRAMEGDDEVTEVVGIARRLPALEMPKVRWVSADVSRDALVPHLRGAAAVVHLAWQIQPSRDLERLHRTNVVGTSRVLSATVQAGVPVVVHASSVGAYSPAPKDRLVDESWATHGLEDSSYSRHKAYCERLCDALEAEHPEMAVLRLRPALIFKRGAGSAIRRLFMGSLLPNVMVRPAAIPLLPQPKGLRLQALHSHDAGQAYLLAVKAAVAGEATGAFNVAAEPVLDADELGRILDARTVPIPRAALRPVAAATWRMRLHPLEPGWISLALKAPLLDSGRARSVLGWRPERSAVEAVRELLEGLREESGLPTPPLESDAERSRVAELRTGQGQREQS
jgi:UDP-glucose 4-epimerase